MLYTACIIRPLRYRVFVWNYIFSAYMFVSVATHKLAGKLDFSSECDTNFVLFL